MTDSHRFTPPNMLGGWQRCHFSGRVHTSRGARPTRNQRPLGGQPVGDILRSQSTDTEVELTEGMNLDKAGASAGGYLCLFF